MQHEQELPPLANLPRCSVSCNHRVLSGGEKRITSLLYGPSLSEVGLAGAAALQAKTAGINTDRQRQEQTPKAIHG